MQRSTILTFLFLLIITALSSCMPMSKNAKNVQFRSSTASGNGNLNSWQQMQQMMQSNCLSCHSGQGPGNVNLAVSQQQLLNTMVTINGNQYPLVTPQNLDHSMLAYKLKNIGVSNPPVINNFNYNNMPIANWVNLGDEAMIVNWIMQLPLGPNTPILTISAPTAETYFNNYNVNIAGTCSHDNLPVDITGLDLAQNYQFSCQQNQFQGRINFIRDASPALIKASQDNNGLLGERTVRIYIDTIMPLIGFEPSPPAGAQGNLGITFNLHCEMGLNVAFSGQIMAKNPLMCHFSPMLASVTFLPGADGNRNVVISQTDLASNFAEETRVFVKNSTVPAIAFDIDAPTNNMWTNQLTVAVEGDCTSGPGMNVLIREKGNIIQTLKCNNNRFVGIVTLPTLNNFNDIEAYQMNTTTSQFASDVRRVNHDNIKPHLKVLYPTASNKHLLGVYITGTCDSTLPVRAVEVDGQDLSVMCDSSGQFMIENISLAAVFRSDKLSSLKRVNCKLTVSIFPAKSVELTLIM